ncbi:4-hydroxybenzoate 3-monooxygenase [Kineococcus sp. SYSU DK003]|uniref:4-hydroxybenzoate 3-monooxygenase n=1 Tax=Kineococcus sp. SYSU DK003 TaxID=3383124 RepID=UPI003D7F0636
MADRAVPQDVDVVVVGAGPAGLLTAHLLRRQGLRAVVLERSSREHVEARVRAGLLELGTVEALRKAGLAGRLDAEALVHDGLEFRVDGVSHRLAFGELTGTPVFMYGQQLVVRDLLAAADADEAEVRFEATDVQLSGLTSPTPLVTATTPEGPVAFRCRAVAGCDGYHGVSRRAAPAGVFREFVREHPYAWFGALAHTPPVSEELVYTISERGFALLSMRSRSVSRVYLQVPRGTRPQDVPDEQLWSELQQRLGGGTALTPGPVLERVLVDLRSVVVEPMQYGRLFLAGDAAHIVPPSAAKGLNMAVEDAEALAEALVADLRDGQPELLATYSQRRLPGVWQAQAFSDLTTNLFHTPGGADPHAAALADRLRRAALQRVLDSTTAARDFSEHYVGAARR